MELEDLSCKTFVFFVCFVVKKKLNHKGHEAHEVKLRCSNGTRFSQFIQD